MNVLKELKLLRLIHEAIALGQDEAILCVHASNATNTRFQCECRESAQRYRAAKDQVLREVCSALAG